MKKIFSRMLIVLSIGVFSTQVNAIDHSASFEQACVFSKILSNSIPPLASTIATFPSFYYLSKNYITKSTKKPMVDNDGIPLKHRSFLVKVGNIIENTCKSMINVSSATMGSVIIAYFIVNKIDISEDILKIFGYGSWVEQLACNNITWPLFKSDFGNAFVDQLYGL